MVPQDSFFFASLAGRPDEVMIEIFSSLDPELRGLLDEVASGTGHYNGTIDLLRNLTLHVQPGIFLTMRRNDYPEKTGNNKLEHDNAPVPAVALIAKVARANAYEELLKMMQRDMGRLVDGEIRQWDLPLHGGASGKSFSSPLIPGTGEVILVNLPNQRAIVLCNSWDYAEDITQAAMASSSGSKSNLKLSKRAGFRHALGSLESGASLFLYLDPSEAWHWLDKLADDIALSGFKDWMDQRYSTERPGIAKRLSQELFGTTGRLSASDHRKLDDAIDDELIEMSTSEQGSRLPELKTNFMNGVLPLKWFDWMAIGLKASRKSASISFSGQLDLEN